MPQELKVKCEYKATAHLSTQVMFNDNSDLRHHLQCKNIVTPYRIATC